jgi:hypothetical protein
MLQQVTITSQAKIKIKPLLESALTNEKKLLKHGLQRTKERLSAFEVQQKMSSEEFARRFEAGELEETLDYIDWLMEIKALHMLEEQYDALDEAQVD